MGGEEIKAALGLNIKEIRTQRRYSQAELAERADISIIYLSNIERGVKYPKPAILYQISEGLDVEVYELFKTKHMPKPKPAPNNNKLINEISKKMNQKIIKTMGEVFSQYLR